MYVYLITVHEHRFCSYLSVQSENMSKFEVDQCTGSINEQKCQNICFPFPLQLEPTMCSEIFFLSPGKPGSAVTSKRQPQSKVSKGSASPSASSVQESQGPSAQMLERYLNDSLHAWFRQEFLMEYQAEAGRLVCMVCSCPLPSLHLDHIKSHVLELHPDSLVYSAEEKHCILQSWSQTHGEQQGSLNIRMCIKQVGNSKMTREVY